MRSRVLGTASVLAALVVTPLWAGDRALLVGCTAYPSLPEGSGLEGPAADVGLMRSLLVDRFRFHPDAIVSLTEGDDPAGRPTRENIVREVRRLVASAEPGARIVLFMAGHGTQQPDQHPPQPDDYEPDGLDEVFLPADIGAWDGGAGGVENAIVDDELRGWLAQMTGAGATVWAIFDCCHSGSVSRDAGPAVERRRQLPPDLLTPRDVLEAAGKRVEARRGAGTRDPGPRDPGDDANGAFTGPAGGDADAPGSLVALFAAQSTEYTVERPFPIDAPASEQRVFGLLTYSLNQVLRSADRPLTHRQLIERVHALHRRWNRVMPTPLLDGQQLDRVVLGTDIVPTPVLLRGAGRPPTLSAGRLEGVTAGSVYRWSATEGGAEHTGHVRVVQARLADSVVEPCAWGDQPLVAELPDLGEAELAERDAGLRPLRVAFVGAPAPERLAGGEPGLWRPVDQASGADWLVLGDPSGGALELRPAAADLRPRSGSDGPPVAPPPLVATPGGLAGVLRAVARAENLLRFATPAVGERLVDETGLRVEIRLVRYANLDDTRGEELSLARGAPELRVGDLVGFRITNQSRAAVDVSLLLLDCGYGVTPYFPNPQTPAGANRIEAGRTIDTPRAHVAPGTVGAEHMIVLATEAQVPAPDFAWLAQPTLEAARDTAAQSRGAGALGGGAPSPLAALLEQGAFGLRPGRSRGLNPVEQRAEGAFSLTWRVVP